MRSRRAGAAAPESARRGGDRAGGDGGGGGRRRGPEATGAGGDGGRRRRGPEAARRGLRQAVLAACHQDGAAADQDPLDTVARAVRAGIQHRGPLDLRALADLDLGAEGDAAVPGQVDGERPAAEPVAGSLATASAGQNTRVVTPTFVWAKQLTLTGILASFCMSGARAATVASSANST